MVLPWKKYLGLFKKERGLFSIYEFQNIFKMYRETCMKLLTAFREKNIC